jgi:hypothetical protein
MLLRSSKACILVKAILLQLACLYIYIYIYIYAIFLLILLFYMYYCILEIEEQGPKCMILDIKARDLNCKGCNYFK